jgi:hypothetical protein
MLAEKIRSNCLHQRIKDECSLQVMVHINTHAQRNISEPTVQSETVGIASPSILQRIMVLPGMMFKFRVAVLISKRLTNVCKVPFVLCMQEKSDPDNHRTNQ